MFNHILKLKKDGVKKPQDKTQQDVSWQTPSNGQSYAWPPSSPIKTSNITLEKSESKQSPKRLKLKDYMKLNQISKQKRSRSSQSLKIQSNKKIGHTYDLDLKITFAKPEVPDSARKSIKSYSEQASIQRSRLMETVDKLKEKFRQIMLLIEETTQKFQNYNDLVFMFRIEEVLNDYIKKGINKLTESYQEYVTTEVNGGVLKEMLEKKFDWIFAGKSGTQSPEKDLTKPEISNVSEIMTKGDIKIFKNEKMRNSNILPVSMGMLSPKKQVQRQYNSVYIEKSQF